MPLLIFPCTFILHAAGNYHMHLFCRVHSPGKGGKIDTRAGMLWHQRQSSFRFDSKFVFDKLAFESELPVWLLRLSCSVCLLINQLSILCGNFKQLHLLANAQNSEAFMFQKYELWSKVYTVWGLLYEQIRRWSSLGEVTDWGLCFVG